MKPILFFVLSALAGFGIHTQARAQAAETVNLTFKYEVLNTREGYSYDAKLEVYADGKEVGESTAKDQKIPNAVMVTIPKGEHKIKAVLLARYDDKWEERTIANEYSNDFVWTKEGKFNKDTEIKLYFDIDSGVHEKKKPKAKKK